jgi:hypothetical protein
MKWKQYKYPFIITLTVICIMIAFFWNEKLDRTKRINDQKVTNFFITVFTAIGTIATIVYTIKQYKLSELINRTSIKPDIYPQGNMFEIIDDDEPLSIEGLENLFLTHVSFLKPELNFSIKNAGIGIAKNVTISWIYNLDEVKMLIKNIYHPTPNDSSIPTPYLHPNTDMKIQLPNSYLSCYGPKLFKGYDEATYFSNENSNLPLPTSEPTLSRFLRWKDENFPKKRPRLLLEIKYDDVQNFKYTKTFETKVIGVCFDKTMVTFDFTEIN